jgi:hypothetical protein
VTSRVRLAMFLVLGPAHAAGKAKPKAVSFGEPRTRSARVFGGRWLDLRIFSHTVDAPGDWFVVIGLVAPC